MSFAAYVSWAFCSVSFFIGIFVKSCCEQNLLTTLVNDNTAECNVSQEKSNYHEIIPDGAIGMKETI